VTIAGLTRKQRAALDFIEGFIAGRGFSPSISEIAQRFNFRSRAGAHRLVGVLRARGFITFRRRQARSIAIVGASGKLTLELPPELEAKVQALAARARVSPAEIVIEAVRDSVSALRSQLPVSRETALVVDRSAATAPLSS
jgi:SOS-response transcriptional repressor LexA